MRRIARAAYLGEKLGDTSALENPASLEEIKRAAAKFALNRGCFDPNTIQHVVWNMPPTGSVCASLL